MNQLWQDLRLKLISHGLAILLRTLTSPRRPYCLQDKGCWEVLMSHCGLVLCSPDGDNHPTWEQGTRPDPQGKGNKEHRVVFQNKDFLQSVPKFLPWRRDIMNRHINFSNASPLKYMTWVNMDNAFADICKISHRQIYFICFLHLFNYIIRYTNISLNDYQKSSWLIDKSQARNFVMKAHVKFTGTQWCKYSILHKFVRYLGWTNETPVKFFLLVYKYRSNIPVFFSFLLFYLRIVCHGHV